MGGVSRVIEYIPDAVVQALAEIGAGGIVLAHPLTGGTPTALAG
jgi:hypothetical protein